MYPVSPAFMTAITKSHRIHNRATVIGTGISEEIGVQEQGFVNIDEDQEVLRRASLKLFDKTGTWTPGDVNDLLHPLAANEIFLERGVYISGVVEYVPLGVFRPITVEVGDGGEGLTINIEASDRASKMAGTGLRELYYVPNGTNAATAIKDLITYAYGAGLTYNFMTTALTVPPKTLSVGDDPWKAAQKMASDIGAQLYFNQTGICILEPVPDPSSAPVKYEYTDGDNSILLYVNKRVTIEGQSRFANNVVVIGEPMCSGCVPVTSSASVATGPSGTAAIGYVTYVHRTTGIHTQAQADAVAAAELNKRFAGTEEVRIITIPNPAHEQGDIVKVERGRAKINSRYTMSKLTIPMEAEQPLNVTMRERYAA